MELYPHQKTVLDATKDYNRVAYYLDMGLSKTFVGSEKMKVMNSPVNLDDGSGIRHKVVDKQNPK